MTKTKLQSSFLVKVGDDGKVFHAAIVWKNLLGFAFMHLIGLYGLYLAMFEAKWLSLFWYAPCAFLMDVGVISGAHRLWTHKTYKATPALKLFLTFCFTICGQNCTYIWARDHRQHHKYSDTSKDPHDSTRGFFFCHMGWLMVRKHPDVLEAGKTIDMSDLGADEFVMFQKRYYKTLYTICGVILPMAVPYYCWGETPVICFCFVYMVRYLISLHITWLVNSAAHIYGYQPYDHSIVPRENLFVSVATGGEGWHNYHHTFPYDYKASEFGKEWNFNAAFITWLNRLGFAYDLREVSRDNVEKRVRRAGDGTHRLWGKKTIVEEYSEDKDDNMNVIKKKCEEKTC